MKISTTDINFKSTNVNVRKLDQISRNVKRTFPVKSSTWIEGYNTINHRTINGKIIKGINNKLDYFRNYYTNFSDKSDVFIAQILNIMKKERLGNCFEQAIATTTALQMNGYTNARTCALYGYNKVTNSFRDLDHVVSVVNLSDKSNNFGKMIDDIFIKPDNKSIIIDTWAGHTGFAKNSVAMYHGNIPLKYHLKENEELVLQIFPYNENFSKDFNKYLAYKYPELILERNKKRNIFGFLYNKPKYNNLNAKIGPEYTQNKYCF